MKKIKEETPTFQDKYVVIGADLSLKRPGFAYVEIDNDNGKAEIVNSMLFSVDNKKTTKKTRGRLLSEIGEQFKQIMQIAVGSQKQIFFVREASINNSSFGKRSGTAARTGISEVVGVMDLLAWEKLEAEWQELYPVSIKKLITGNGRAEKELVAQCLEYYVKDKEYKNDDESDAMAVAIAWLIKNNQIKQHDFKVK